MKKDSLNRVIKSPTPITEKDGLTVFLAGPMTGRRYVAISVCHQLTPVLYDLSEFQGGLDAFLDAIVIRDPSGRRDRRQ